MSNAMKHKLYMGFKGLMFSIPPWFSAKGAKKSEKGARAHAGRLSPIERRVHHCIVRKLARAAAPFSGASIAGELGLPEHEVERIVTKLENMKTFVFRSDGKLIDWAYPISLNDTGYKVTVATGESFFAA